MAALLSALFGGGGAGGEVDSLQKGPSWSLQRFTDLYNHLTNFRESDLERPGGGDAVVEIVRQITEALVWGEQHDGSFFDFFCEKGIFSDFIRVLSLSKAPKHVKVQLLQTLSMLFQNIRRETSLIYLLSNRQVNRLISMPLDFTDEEILAYYITLLKCLAMRINAETVQFFFVAEPEPSFPLYTSTTKFFNHRDQMVRATVRTITLQIFPVNYEPVQKFLHAHAESSYFSELAAHLRDIWLRLSRAATFAEDAAALQHENDLQQDLLIYMSDVFNLGIVSLNRVLADRLLHVAMVPLLVASLEGGSSSSSSGSFSSGGSLQQSRRPSKEHCEQQSRRSSKEQPEQQSRRSSKEHLEEQQQHRMAPKVALFLLRQVFDTIRDKLLLEPLAALLLHPKVPPQLLASLEPSAPREFRSYLVRHLRPSEDACFLFAVALIHSCVLNREALAVRFLETARIFPRFPAEYSGPYVSEQHLDVPWFLLQALQEHAAWRPETFHALVSTVRDIFLDPILYGNADCRSAAQQKVQAAFESAGRHLEKLLQEQLGAAGATSDDDALLDAFMEEWEAGRAAPANVADLCTAAWRWLLSPAGSSSARGRGMAAGPADRASSSAPPPLRQDAARRAVRCFLSLRRLHGELQVSAREVAPQERAAAQPMMPATSAGRERARGAPAAEEPSPLQVDFSSPADRQLREGRPVDLGLVAERVPCSLSSHGGATGNQRCVLLHDSLLLLAQPDSSQPSRAVVTTMWPLQQVHSLIDRGDPRILRLGMQAFFGGGCPGEASAYSPPVCVPEAAQQRRSAFYTMALHFEDVRMCHAADQHLRRRRREVRCQLLQKAADFLQECLRRPSREFAVL